MPVQGKIIFGASILAASLAVPAHGQSGPAPTREEINPDATAPLPEEGLPQVEVEGEIERAPCPLAQPRFAAIRFTLRGVEFTNLGPIDPAWLTPAYADYIGQDLPIAAVCEIRDRSATILRDRGYLAAVQVPPQNIDETGQLRLDILAATVSRIQVRGDPGNSEALLEDYLEPLVTGEIFNQREAERQLLLARQLPGYDTRLTLRPDPETPGSVIGDVRVERTPFIVEGQIQNFGSRSTGRFGGQIRAQFNDVTGLGDTTGIAVFSSADFDEQLVVNIGHSFAIGDDGLRLGGQFTYAWNDPTIAGISPFDTETLVANFSASYPFILDQGTRLVGSAGFDIIDQDIEFGGVALNRDRLRVAFIRADLVTTDRASIEGQGGYSAAEPRWRFGLAGELRQGIDIFGASDRGLPPAVSVPQTRSAGKSGATVLRIEGLAEFRPTPLVAFVLAPRAQISGEPLLTYEEFSAGNYTVGRGYDPGSILGDSGFGFRYELRYGSAIPRSRDDIAWQGYGFFDAAWIWNEDPAFLGFSDSDEIYSAGAGLRANWGDRARLDVTMAVPLKRTDFQVETPDVRLLASLTFRFAR